MYTFLVYKVYFKSYSVVKIRVLINIIYSPVLFSLRFPVYHERLPFLSCIFEYFCCENMMSNTYIHTNCDQKFNVLIWIRFSNNYNRVLNVFSLVTICYNIMLLTNKNLLIICYTQIICNVVFGLNVFNLFFYYGLSFNILKVRGQR